MAIVLNEPMDGNQIALRLQDQLPVGLQITDCFPSVAKPKERSTNQRRYHVELKDGFFNVHDLDWFLDQRAVNIERKRKRGPAARIDLKQAVVDIQILDDRHAQMLLGNCENQTIRPAVVLKTIFHLSDQQLLTAIITKQKSNHV